MTKLIPKCNQCDSATINGFYCHEKGCPNIKKYWNDEEEMWMEDENFYEDGEMDWNGYMGID